MSTFETLPDEILMIIVRYSGNAYTVFRTYSGLNQRLNNILVDRRLHLFTELLYTNINDPDIKNYYNSNSFYQVCHQFSTLKTTEDDKQLHQCLQSLVASYVVDKYERLNYEFQSTRKQFQSICAHLTTSEIITLDDEIKRAFRYLPVDLCPQDRYCTWESTLSSQSMIKMKEIEFLVLTQDASLECYDDDE